MNKKIISLVLALVMVLGTFTSVFAAEPTKKAEAKKAEAGEKVEKVVGKDNKIQYIIDKKLVEGYEDGTYGLDKNIKRSEITRLLVLANGQEELAKKLQGSMRIYSDVDVKHWANGVISVGTTVPSDANGIAMLAGYPDGSFKPENDVTYAELAKMLVVLAKKDLTADMVKNAIWATSWMRWAAELGILDDVTVTDSNKAANRADAFTMVYNALYSMKYFKRTPANETMGIVSQFKNNELTLNQGEKAKTFKLSNTTVFFGRDYLDINAKSVKGNGTYAQKLVKAAAINNPEYYYGSLVRVITDKDNNVTHIIELGNPQELAIGITGYKGENKQWLDVAEYTVETVYNKLNRTNVAAKINYKNGDAKTIEFTEGKFSPIEGTNNFRLNDSVGTPTELKLTKDTRYFVADVDRNQLTEVKDVDEAIRILGNTSAAHYFFDVYAGFDDFGGIDAHKTSKNTAVAKYNEAKVVVFNVVQKDNNNAQVVRVTNEANSKFGLTFEDTDGKKVDVNVATYRGNFPFNVGPGRDSAKFDVVKYSVNAARHIVVEGIIDHSDTDLYPIVKVIDVDGRNFTVKDAKGNYAYLQLDSEADVFLNGQLKKDAVIQFRTLAKNELKDANKVAYGVKDTNVVDTVSVLPKDFELKGSLLDVTEANYYNQSYANTPALTDFTNYGTDYQKVILNNYRGLESLTARDLVVMNNTEADALKAFLKAHDKYSDGIRFKLRNFDKAAGFEAYDVEVLVNGNWVAVRTIAPVTNNSAYIISLINDLNTKYNNDKCPADLVKARAEIQKVDDAIAALTDVQEKADWSAYKYQSYKTALEQVKTQIGKCEAKARLAAAEKALKDVNLKDINVLNAQNLQTSAQADVDKEIETRVMAATLTGVKAVQKADITITRDPAATGTAYQFGETLKVTVKLTDATLNREKATVELTATVITK
ncbi:hypothetical protein HMPREF3229_01783 [Peptoniphilus harei]|uniref:SLH domain-containing protein n=1 Tax=Peptoniphilus harei TaxID=54005 RepID=A0A133PI17_9FIRM|nr:S-layer homology domain-containing protein [Peptoniphilus harei]KXA28198.1 hypothetical protein HMPREF3229_01783 [Peptoniphilus harei]